MLRYYFHIPNPEILTEDEWIDLVCELDYIMELRRMQHKQDLKEVLYEIASKIYT